VRVVLDTNVLVASFVTRGQCAEVVEHCLRNLEPVSSEVLLSELFEKLTRKLRFSSESASEAVALLRRKCLLVIPGALPVPVSRDPDDDWVLATALAGDAEIIITGDKDLLVLHEYQSIRIVAPGPFSRSEDLP
jgi:putative PIN family toxin of toxin-antitoxin system